MARFRPFGRRQDGPGAPEPDPWLDDPAPGDLRAPADDRDRDVRDRGVPFGPSIPATRAATPAMWAPRPAEPTDPVDPVDEDRAPVTDPFGFPPVPPVAGAPAWAAWVPERSPRSVAPTRVNGAEARSPWAADDDGAGPVVSSPVQPVQADVAPPGRATGAGRDVDVPDRAAPPDGPGAARRPVDGGAAAPDPADAAALAGAFAADYLSWDEDDPARRGRALSDHLPGPAAGHALLGWSGTGRQRAEIVLPGAVRPDGDGRLHVDVRVRVTPYRRVSRSEAVPEPDPRDALGTPSAAPPVTARGWRGLAARWVRLGVTVVRDGDRLVVDAGEETFDEPEAERHRPLPAPARPAGTADDPTLDGDDVAPAGSGR